MGSINLKSATQSPEDWQSQFELLQKNYHLKTTTFELEGHTLEITKVTDINDLLERATHSDEIPFWAELWPSSIGVARYILQNWLLFKDRVVLELGAGVGLAGIAAKLAGAQVVQSDFSMEALRFSKLNCLRNRVPITELLLADWRNFPVEASQFDFIIGADILYEKNMHGYLEKIFLNSLQQNGKVILADPGRAYAREFVQAAMAKAWGVEQSQIPVFYEDHTYDIDIYQLIPQGNRGGSVSL